MKQKKQNKQKLESMRRRSRILIIVSLALFGVVIFIWNKQGGVVLPGNGELITPITEHDFGAVPVSGGAVSVELPLVNIGEEDLVIHFLESSCGCTTARVINKGKAGPIFGMSSHGNSPRNWRTTIAPGERAALKIIYDPTVHKHFRGDATRVITIFSNEKANPEKEVRIKVNQVD